VRIGVETRSGEPVRSSERAGASVLALCGFLLVAAGGLELVAAGIRWTPCLEAYDAIACLQVEDHSRDYGIVSEPFVLIPLAVPLAGVASLLLVAFWSIVAAAPWADGWARVLALVTAVTLVVVGAGQLLASLSDGTVGVLATLPAGVVFWVLLFAPVVAAARLAFRSSSTVMERVAWAVVALSVALGNQLTDLFFLYPFSSSHDTPVGSGVPHAALSLLAGLALLLAAIVVGARRRPSRRVEEDESADRPAGDVTA
jgi:hypothetical protein